MKKIGLILCSVISINLYATNAVANTGMDNQYYQAVEKLQDHPLSLNVKETDQKYISIYTSVKNTMVSLNTQKNNSVFSQFKNQIEAECNKLKSGSTENVSSAYCKASLNAAIYAKL
ncbi:hypothetical protein [Acinetobacter gyllenbergii]|uniref:hypothetical protein n=1 Tax=Acinetobacter gyllenbergii TaxID=134534 RepID=UPI003F56B2CF